MDLITATELLYKRIQRALARIWIITLTMILVQKSVITIIIIGLNHQEVRLFIFLFQKSCRKCSSQVDTSGSWVTGCWAITAISAISPCWCADKHHVNCLTCSDKGCLHFYVAIIYTSHFCSSVWYYQYVCNKNRFICPKLQSWRRRGKVKMVYFPYDSICHL